MKRLAEVATVVWAAAGLALYLLSGNGIHGLGYSYVSTSDGLAHQNLEYRYEVNLSVVILLAMALVAGIVAVYLNVRSGSRSPEDGPRR